MIRLAAGRRGARGSWRRSSAARGPGLAARAVIVSVGLWGSAGFAQPDLNPRPAPPVAEDNAAVEITVVGGPEDLRRIRSVIEPRPIQGTTTRWTRAARFDPMEILHALKDAPQAGVRAWVDTSEPRRARLYFAARSGQRFLVRDVELSRAFDAVDRESLSNVLELSIRALIENEKVGLTRAEAQEVLAGREASRQSAARRDVPPVPAKDVAGPPAAAPPAAAEPAAPPPAAPPGPAAAAAAAAPAPASAPPPPPAASAVTERPPLERDPRVRPELRVFYGATAPGGGLPITHGPGLELALGSGAADRLALGTWLSAHYLWTTRYSGASVGADLESIRARAGLECVLAASGSTSRVSVRVGVGTDAVHLTPRPGATDGSAVLTAPRWSQNLAFTVAIGLRRALGSRWLLGAALLADILPTVVHYDQAVGGVSSEVVSPWRVRPGLLFEVGIR